MKRIIVLLFAGLITASCGLKAADVVKIIAEVQAPPTNVTPPPVPAPEPTPVPVVVPEPEVIDSAPLPFQNLNVRVFDADGRAPIVGALVVNQTTHENRTTDGSGFVNFGVQTATDLRVSAVDYAPETRGNVAPGNADFLLVSTKPKPVKPTGPLACGRQLNTGYVSFECLDAVGRVSQHWTSCAQGSSDDCSLYVWEVVRALNDAQQETRWGLITKRAGSNFRGYGEDVVAYLPQRFAIGEQTWQWNGVDIIGGLGGPKPTRNPGKLHNAIPCTDPPSAEQEAERWCNRSDNLWSPVPVQ